MIVKKSVWHNANGIYKYDVDIIITAGNEQILFNSHYVGQLALASRVSLDVKNGIEVFCIEYGNSRVIGSSLDNSVILNKVKRWLKRQYQDGDFIKEVRFVEAGDLSFGDKHIEFNLK